jgi:glycosyltransferase involved in cell wall biosynthesis
MLMIKINEDLEEDYLKSIDYEKLIYSLEGFYKGENHNRKYTDAGKKDFLYGINIIDYMIEPRKEATVQLLIKQIAFLTHHIYVMKLRLNYLVKFYNYKQDISLLSKLNEIDSKCSILKNICLKHSKTNGNVINSDIKKKMAVWQTLLSERKKLMNPIKQNDNNINLTLPKISIIVPVYNVEKYVAKCIESIINQTYKNLEIIIVDDGSTDKSSDICENYLKKDNRIKLIHQENQRLSVARNNALAVANGDYIGFVDSDDWIAQDMYYTLYNNAVEYNADISMCNFYYVSVSGEKTPYSSENSGIKILEGVYKIAHNIRLPNNYVWNRLYKRSLFNDIRFPERKIFEDTFIMHKLIDAANKVVLSSECKYYYLRRESSITLSKFTLEQMDHLDAYIERHDYISVRYPNLEKVCRKFIFSCLLWSMRNACRDNKISIYEKILRKNIDKIRCYSYSNCGLSAREIYLLELLFKDIDGYVTEMSNTITENSPKGYIINVKR